MPASATCATCVHYSALGSGSGGECRKNPPALVPLGIDPQGNLRTHSAFPPTRSNAWCGAHEAAPKPEQGEPS